MLSIRFFVKGTQVLATIDIITSVLSFTSIFLVVYLTIGHGDRLEAKLARDQYEHPELAALFALGRGPFIMVMLLFMLICLCYFYLARYLLHAANERTYSKIHRWCTITLVIIITRAAFFITAVYFTDDRAFVSSFGVIGFLYQIFSLWFVRTFEDRLRTEGEGMKTKMLELGDTNMTSFSEATFISSCSRDGFDGGLDSNRFSEGVGSDFDAGRGFDRICSDEHESKLFHENEMRFSESDGGGKLGIGNGQGVKLNIF